MGALEGIHVLDAASMMAGPYCATLLGDMGAEVIKLEPPQGDETRRIGPRKGSESGVFVGVNRNKRSVAVDLRTEQGKEVLSELVQWADVIVDNLRPAARARYGLDHQSLSAQNPRIVSVSLSTFGADGPYAGRPGIDPVAQALSGLMAVTGFSDSGPLKAGPPVGDAVASLLAAFGAMSAHGSRPASRRLFDRRFDSYSGALHGSIFSAGNATTTYRQQHRLVRAVQRIRLFGWALGARRLL